jgi:hypothetical protein
MYEVIILVCAMALTPMKCQMNTATHVLHAPEASDSLTGCMMHGMQYAAESNVVTEGYYPKVFCVAPTNIGKETTG